MTLTVNLKCKVVFPPMFTNGNNFCDSLFTFLEGEALLKKGVYS